jgi:hypothetical protein
MDAWCVNDVVAGSRKHHEHAGRFSCGLRLRAFRPAGDGVRHARRLCQARHLGPALGRRRLAKSLTSKLEGILLGVAGMTRACLVGCVLLAVLLAACGGKAEEASGSSDAGAESAVYDSGADAHSLDAGTDSGTGAALVCPVEAPAQGAACSGAGGCQYGTNFDEGCIQIAECTPSGWNVTGPASECTPTVCPPSYAALTDGGLQACASSLQVTDCWYPQGLCQCSAGLGGPAAPLGWYCVPVAPGCPYPTPAAGSPCTNQGQICGGSCGGAGVSCDGGTWQANVSPCPV